MGVHSPFATVIWDYINRGMPLGKEGSLTPNEVYSLTAFLLHKNDVIREDEVMDAKTLPKVKMPNRDGFALPPEWKPATPRLQGYPSICGARFGQTLLSAVVETPGFHLYWRRSRCT